jgi:osmotically-inducible protein OsmY
LRESPELADCPIRCEFHEGTLTLRGRVPRYSLKQAARSLVRGTPGVTVVDNRIDVIPLPAAVRPSHERRTVPGVDRFRAD